MIILAFGPLVRVGGTLTGDAHRPKDHHSRFATDGLGDGSPGSRKAREQSTATRHTRPASAVHCVPSVLNGRLHWRFT
ncbi:hypothetical protein [Kitasatospora sp. NPDC088134]|uniref:hypothetical protein n=1 Tax=Kitasatospora sp. NPDC088134 TaxID=3364071 RepID=UPI00382FFEA5